MTRWRNGKIRLDFEEGREVVATEFFGAVSRSWRPLACAIACSLGRAQISGKAMQVSF